MADDPFNKIILKFPDKHHTKTKSIQTISLDDLLEDINGAKSICQIEDFECNCCNTRTVATKHQDIINYPRVLMIVLVRKRKDGGRINTKVDFSLGKHFVDNRTIYHLVGIVNHVPTNGNTDGGHYTAITESDTVDRWHQYNDDKVIHINYVIKKRNHKVYANYQREAYVLCYQQSGIEHNPSHNLQAQVQGAQVIHESNNVSAHLAGDDASVSVTYNYSLDDDDPYQSGSSSAHDEPGNEDSVMAQPSFGFALGGHSSNQTC